MSPVSGLQGDLSECDGLRTRAVSPTKRLSIPYIDLSQPIDARTLICTIERSPPCADSDGPAC
jgi:hypothetical protein